MKHKIRYWWKCFAWCYSINHILWYWFHVVTLLLNYNHMINWSSDQLIPALAELGGLISVGHVCQYMKFVLDIRVSSSIVRSIRGGDNLEYHFWLQVEGRGTKLISSPPFRFGSRIMIYSPTCTDPDAAISNKDYRYGVLICFSLGNTSSWWLLASCIYNMTSS